MMICRMLSPGLLAALLHAENWVDHKDRSHAKDRRSDQSVSKQTDVPDEHQSESLDYISRSEQALHRSLFLS